ncbi:MAG TPA: proline/glycine betaine ABC transporter permease [Tissierellaceae bacterium]|nr:proline/glycine betaine ABC transporter permease [Tissierellaceae bacterium]
MINLQIGSVFESLIDWLTNNLDFIFDGLRTGILFIIEGIESILLLPPAIVLIILIALLAWKVAGKGVSIFSFLGLLLIDSMELWTETMQSLGLVLTATFIALVIGIPLGIWSSKSDKVNKVMRPILDFMQTMPAFVHLIPAVIFFDLGVVPGAVATIIFSMPPVVRLTGLGIRQVPEDIIEASRSFGATSRQMLFEIQIPLAIPTILAGVNQTIMLALSMVVISAMIGAGGLGEVVLRGITKLEIGVGFEGGIAVVVLAMILDRITQSLGDSKTK